MTNNSKLIKSFNIRYGIYLGIYWIVYVFIFHITNLIFTQYVIFFIIGILIQTSIIAYGIANYKKENHNILTLKNALKCGIVISLISGIILALYYFFYTTIIDPDTTNKITLTYEEWMIQNRPNFSAKEMYNEIKHFQKYNSPYIITLILFIATLFFGFFTSLVLGATLSKKKEL